MLPPAPALAGAWLLWDRATVCGSGPAASELLPGPLRKPGAALAASPALADGPGIPWAGSRWAPSHLHRSSIPKACLSPSLPRRPGPAPSGAAVLSRASATCWSLPFPSPQKEGQETRGQLRLSCCSLLSASLSPAVLLVPWKGTVGPRGSGSDGGTRCRARGTRRSAWLEGLPNPNPAKQLPSWQLGQQEGEPAQKGSGRQRQSCPQLPWASPAAFPASTEAPRGWDMHG